MNEAESKKQVVTNDPGACWPHLTCLRESLEQTLSPYSPSVLDALINDMPIPADPETMTLFPVETTLHQLSVSELIATLHHRPSLQVETEF